MIKIYGEDTQIIEWAEPGDGEGLAARRWILTDSTFVWSLDVRAPLGSLDRVDIEAETLDTVVLRWAAIRSIFGFGPTPEELRAAAVEIECARAELTEETGRS